MMRDGTGRRSFLLPAGVVLGAVLTGERAAGGNWPEWRGPAGRASARRPVSRSWSDAEGIAWKRELPGWGTSTPAIWGDAIFVTTQKDEDLLLLRISKKDGLDRLDAADRRSGRSSGCRRSRKARGDRGGQHFHDTQNLASPSPVTDGERVVVHFGNGDLASSTSTGTSSGSRNLQEDHGAYTIWWGHANSPILHEDLVISVCMQDALTRPRRQAGAELRRGARSEDRRAALVDACASPAPRRSPATPTRPRYVHAGTDGPEMVVVGGTWIDAYDPATGRERWGLTDVGGNRTITGPTIGDGILYSTVGMRGPLLALRLGGRETLPQTSPGGTRERRLTRPVRCVSGDRLHS